MNNNILDLLSGSEVDLSSVENEEVLFQISIPEKCANCNTANVCNVYPSLVSLSKIGIVISIEQCNYCVPNKTNKNSK